VRAGCRVSPVSTRAADGPAEPLILAAPRRDATIAAVIAVLTAGLFATVAEHGALIRIQRLDDAWLRLMISGRAPPLTAIAKVFNLIGLVYVTLPVRVAVAGFLAVRRRWWHLAAFTAAVVLSEVLIGVLKGLYDRARPAGDARRACGKAKPERQRESVRAEVLPNQADAADRRPAARRRRGRNEARQSGQEDDLAPSPIRHPGLMRTGPRAARQPSS